MSGARVPGRSGWRLHLPFAVVLSVVLLGVLLIALYYWRRGTMLIGGALLLAAVLRVLLSDEDAGLIAIRSRPVDAMLYAGLGGITMFTALTIS